MLRDGVFWEPWCNRRDTQLGELVSGLRVRDVNLYGDWDRAGWCTGWCHRLAFVPLRDIYRLSAPRIILVTEDARPRERVARLQAAVRGTQREFGIPSYRLSVIAVSPGSLPEALRQWSDIVGIVSSVTWLMPAHERGLCEGRARLRDRYGNAAVVVRSYSATGSERQTLVLQHDGVLDVDLRDSPVLPQMSYAGGTCYAVED